MECGGEEEEPSRRRYFWPKAMEGMKCLFVYTGGKACGQSRFGVRVKPSTHSVMLSFRCLLDTQVEVLVRHVCLSFRGET